MPISSLESKGGYRMIWSNYSYVCMYGSSRNTSVVGGKSEVLFTLGSVLVCRTAPYANHKHVHIRTSSLQCMVYSNVSIFVVWEITISHICNH